MNMTFVFPWRELHWWLGLLTLALAMLTWALRSLERRRRERLDRFVEAKLAPRLLPGYDVSLRKPLFWLVLAGFAALAITFAQPHWGEAWQQIRKQTHDVIICLDTSESMRAVNPLPTRMERAKMKIGALLEQAPGDRFGLVAFSGAAVLQCPLTLDQGYFRAVLNAIDTDTISAEGTDIAAALREAVKVFKDEAEQSGVWDKNTRAILLISDGEQVSGDAEKAAEEAAEYARIYVVGVGDPNGAEIELPEVMARYASGKKMAKTHLSKLDEDMLSKLAVAGNGGYIRSTPDNSDIDQIYQHIVSMSTREVASDLRYRLVNRYQWPLTLAVGCFAGEGCWLAALPLIRRRRLRKEGGASHA